MIQERAFVKVPLKAPAQETKFVPVDLRLVLLFNEEVLFMHDGEVRQYLHRLVPCRMYRLVLVTGNGEQFRQFHLEGYRHVRILAHDAAVLYCQ